MSLRRSGSETEGINVRTDKSHFPGDNRLEMKSESGTVEDKTFEGVFARPDPWGRPAQHSVPVFGPSIGPLIPPAAIRDRGPVMAPPPSATPVSSLPRSYYWSPPVPLYSNSGLRAEIPTVDSQGDPLDEYISYGDDYPPPPEESAYKFKMEETMSPSQDEDFWIFAPPPRMFNGQWVHTPPVAFPKTKDELKSRKKEPIFFQGRVLIACEVCGDIKHDWPSCPLRWRCRFDEKLEDDFEVVCRLCCCSQCNYPNLCSYPYGKAALKEGHEV